MRLIDVDKITDERGKINGIIECGENGMYIRLSDLLNLLDDEPTAYDVEKVVEQLENYLFDKYCVEGDGKISEILKEGGVDE